MKFNEIVRLFMDVYAYVSGFSGLLVGIFHSYLGETRVLIPLFADTGGNAILKITLYRRLLRIVWHIPSFIWAVVGIATCIAVTLGSLSAAMVYAFAAVYIVSGLSNLAALRGVHIGWVMLFSAAGTLLMQPLPGGG